MDYAWFLFRFEGRINRAKYWLAVLIILCWMIFLGMLTVIVIKIFGDTKTFGFLITMSFASSTLSRFIRCCQPITLPLVMKTIGTLLFAWVYMATSIKRLHDRDRSGWWMVPFSSLFRASQPV